MTGKDAAASRLSPFASMVIVVGLALPLVVGCSTPTVGPKLSVKNARPGWGAPEARAAIRTAVQRCMVTTGAVVRDAIILGHGHGADVHVNVDLPHQEKFDGRDLYRALDVMGEAGYPGRKTLLLESRQRDGTMYTWVYFWAPRGRLMRFFGRSRPGACARQEAFDGIADGVTRSVIHDVASGEATPPALRVMSTRWKSVKKA
jgi:hypothetical protein